VQLVRFCKQLQFNHQRHILFMNVNTGPLHELPYKNSAGNLLIQTFH